MEASDRDLTASANQILTERELDGFVTSPSCLLKPLDYGQATGDCETLTLLKQVDRKHLCQRPQVGEQNRHVSR